MEELLEARVRADGIEDRHLQKDEGRAPFVMDPFELIQTVIELAQPKVNQGERVRRHILAPAPVSQLCVDPPRLVLLTHERERHAEHAEVKWLSSGHR